MKAKLEAGVELDFLTQDEARQVFADWIEEIRRGVRFVRRSMTGTVAGAGTLAIGTGFTPDGEAMGPEGSFAWAITRVSVAGLSAAQKISLWTNEAQPSQFLGFIQEAKGHETFTPTALMLNGGDKLLVTGAALTASAVITVTVQAIEIPVQLAWQLL